jgi:arylsulfatase A-like enzyme
MRSSRTNRWNYIRRFHARGKPFLANCAASPTKDLLSSEGWADRPSTPEELFDLVFDPSEVNNLADDRDHAAVLEVMRHRLDGWMVETDDPILSGEIPLPEGAVVSRSDDITPFELWEYTPRSERLA